MTFVKSEKVLDEIRRFYISEIHRAAQLSGGLESLAVEMGHAPKHLYRILQRDSFSALRRTVKEIESMLKK